MGRSWQKKMKFPEERDHLSVQERLHFEAYETGLSRILTYLLINEGPGQGQPPFSCHYDGDATTEQTEQPPDDT